MRSKRGFEGCHSWDNMELDSPFVLLGNMLVKQTLAGEAICAMDVGTWEGRVWYLKLQFHWPLLVSNPSIAARTTFEISLAQI